jgi:hypothetical protein
MNPAAPAANPTTSNTNQPYGGFGQAQSDYGSAANILNNLPSQEASTTGAATNANTNTASILPNIAINAPTYTAPTAQTINAGSYGTNQTGYNSAVQGAEQALTSGENQTYSNAMGQLQSAESQYGNLTPVYQSLASSYGIPGYQNDIATLTGLLQNLNRDVNAQTTLGGGLMTESARDEAYNNQAQPLQQSLNSAGEFLQYGQNDVNNLLDTYEKSLNNALTPLQTNISNLPTLFGQTNEAAQAGYGQGQEAIQSSITDALQTQQVAAQQEQASAAMKQADVLAGAGQSPTLGGTNGAKTAAATYGLKVQGKPQSGYYFEDANGNSINAVQYAQATGTPPIQVITAMAKSGDMGAQQLLNEVNLIGSTPGSTTDPNAAILKYYGSF